MGCLGPLEQNLIKRKIIEKLYFFAPRALTLEKLYFVVDNPPEEDFSEVLLNLVQEKLLYISDVDYGLTDAGTKLYEDQEEFKQYFPIADIPRLNLG